jgi:hypothetical protein
MIGFIAKSIRRHHLSGIANRVQCGSRELLAVALRQRSKAGRVIAANSPCQDRKQENQGLGTSSNTTLSTYGASEDGLATDSYGNLYVVDSNNPRAFLQGYGVRGKLDLSTTAIYFGHVSKGQVSAAHDLTLTNPNPVPLSIGKVSVFTTSGESVNQFAQVADGCANTELAAGAQCTISVTFDPTRIGVMTGDVRIHDDARHSPQDVYLQGTGE